MKKELQELIQEAERQGWRAVRTQKGHWALYAPDGRTIVHLAGTPSDWRAIHNAISRMRRAGFIWPPEGRR